MTPRDNDDAANLDDAPIGAKIMSKVSCIPVSATRDCKDRSRGETRVPERDVGQLAESLVQGYMAHAASEVLLSHPAAMAALEQLEAENAGPAVVPIAPIERLDGTAHFYSVSHFLRETARTPTYAEIYRRLWLGGALIILGDALTAERYFDHGPDLEMVRHLRNGIAHGNRFNLLNGEPRRPAHFTGPQGRLGADGKTPTAPGDFTVFRIDPALTGAPVLFDFMGPGDICDLFQFIGWRLIRLGNGDSDHPLFEQHG